MKMIIALFFFIISVKSFSEEIIHSYRLPKNHYNLQKIVDLFEVKSQNKQGLEIYVLKENEHLFKSLAPKAKLLSEDINASLKSRSQFLESYHNYQTVRETISSFQRNYPDLTKYLEYGKSGDGNPLFALRITSSSKKFPQKHKLMLTAATHGDELITVEVLLGLMESLLKGQTSNERFQKFLEYNEIYFIPVVNPDGYTSRSRYAHQIDPNRSYPMPDGRRQTRKTVQCIEKLISFYNSINFQGSIDFHASGKMIMFPWAFTRETIQSADFQLFDEMTSNMAKRNSYKHGQISKVIYVAKGSSVDYYYSQNRALALGIELTTSKYPQSSQIGSIIKEASEMTWQYLEQFSR